MVEINKNLLNQLYDKYKDLPLLVNEKQSWTFAEFFNKAYLLSDSLCTNLQKRIGLCSENYEFLLLALMAIWMREGIVVPLDPKFPQKKIVYTSDNFLMSCSKSRETHGEPIFRPKCQNPPKNKK